MSLLFLMFLFSLSCSIETFCFYLVFSFFLSLLCSFFLSSVYTVIFVVVFFTFLAIL